MLNLCHRYVVSFSDGVPDESTGIPYFYLTTLDSTARNALKDHRSSLTLKSPACAKITLTSKLVLPDANSKESEFAKAALFTYYPEMIENIFIINGFGGPKPLTVDKYLKYKM
ncbi:hypothetical protein V6Z11_A05G403900 [Gossypium hirsutum]